jgi:hypothetical protein
LIVSFKGIIIVEFVINFWALLIAARGGFLVLESAFGTRFLSELVGIALSIVQILGKLALVLNFLILLDICFSASLFTANFFVLRLELISLGAHKLSMLF